MQLNNMTLQTTSDYRLKHAILIFENERGEGLLTRATIESRGEDGAAISQPVPVTSSVVRQLLLAYSDRDFTLTDACVLAHTSDRCAWWIPPRQAALHYQTADHAISSLSGLKVMQPGLVMLSRAGQLYVYAIKGHERPSGNTPLYLAPYWNLHEDSSVCLGSNPLPSASHEGARHAWQTLFFSTPFSHPNTLPRWTGLTYAQLWECSQREQAFPETYLLSANLTLEELLCKHSK